LTSGLTDVLQEVWEPMEVMGTNDKVEIGKPLKQSLPFLLGETTSHTNNEFSLALFEGSETAQHAVYLVLWLLPNRTGIDQNDVGLMDISSCAIPERMEDLENFLRIVFVHLAAVGFEIHPCRTHARPPGINETPYSDRL
jgi:hypothetical protein